MPAALGGVLMRKPLIVWTTANWGEVIKRGIPVFFQEICDSVDLKNKVLVDLNCIYNLKIIRAYKFLKQNV